MTTNLDQQEPVNLWFVDLDVGELREVKAYPRGGNMYWVPTENRVHRLKDRLHQTKYAAKVHGRETITERMRTLQAIYRKFEDD